MSNTVSASQPVADLALPGDDLPIRRSWPVEKDSPLYYPPDGEEYLYGYCFGEHECPHEAYSADCCMQCHSELQAQDLAEGYGRIMRRPCGHYELVGGDAYFLGRDGGHACDRWEPLDEEQLARELADGL